MLIGALIAIMELDDVVPGRYRPTAAKDRMPPQESPVSQYLSALPFLNC